MGAERCHCPFHDGRVRTDRMANVVEQRDVDVEFVDHVCEKSSQVGAFVRVATPPCRGDSGGRSGTVVVEVDAEESMVHPQVYPSGTDSMLALAVRNGSGQGTTNRLSSAETRSVTVGRIATHRECSLIHVSPVGIDATISRSDADPPSGGRVGQMTAPCTSLFSPAYVPFES